jgi:hypothetical protein
MSIIELYRYIKITEIFNTLTINTKQKSKYGIKNILEWWLIKLANNKSEEDKIFSYNKLLTTYLATEKILSDF